MAEQRKLEGIEGTLELNLVEHIGRDDLMDLIQRIIDENGCSGCGLVGLDLNLRTRGMLGGRFAEVPGLESAKLILPS